MGERNKFGLETEVADTVPKPNAGEGNLKRGNEKGVGTEFTKRYNQILENVIKQKFPDYIDPSTMSIDFNDTRSIEKFNEMSQMKEEILKIVNEKLNEAPTTTEEVGGAAEEPSDVKEELIFTQEDQILYEKLKVEIFYLKKDIENLEKDKTELENFTEQNIESKTESKGDEKVKENISESKNVVSERINIEDYKNEIDRVIRNKFGAAFEDNGLDYENTHVSSEDNRIHTEIKFNYGKIILSFDLHSKNNMAILENDAWKQNRFNKLITLNKLNKKNAEKWSEAILREFIKTKSNDKDFHKIDIIDGGLQIEHKV